MVNETTPLMQVASPDIGNRASGVKGSQARKRRSTTSMKSKKQKAKKSEPVLENLFESKEEESYHGRAVKSWLYTLLNPKSLQLHAVIFKWFIAGVILMDFVFYILSTEPYYQKNGELPPLFNWEEAITSYVFLFEYIARLLTITENRKYKSPIVGRLKYLVTFSALIDLFSTMPYFIEEFSNYELPQLTYLRTFRLFRILKTNSFMKAGDAVRRVLYYNRQIMTLSVFVGLYMVLITSLLMYQLRPRETESREFESIPATMYLATLMLTGQGGPEGDLPWYTKAVVLLTSAFSIGMFAIPVSMLTWGFEAEAARCAKRSRQLAKRRASSTSNLNDESTDEYSTDEDYQKIIAGEESSSSDDDDADAIAKAMKAAFDKSDQDGSGNISFEEFMALSQSRRVETAGLEGRVAVLEDKLDEALDKIDKLCRHFAVRT